MARGPSVSKMERQRWLEKHRAGATLGAIAREDGRDASIVGKNIKKAEKEEEHLAARSAIFEDSIRSHNTAMVAALRRLKDRLSFKKPHNVTASLSHPGRGFRLHEFPFEDDLANFRIRRTLVEGEHGLENELVREHLQDRVTLWRDYDRWLEDHARYLYDAWRFGEAASRRFQSESGLKPVDEGEGFTASCIIQLCDIGFGLDKDPSKPVEGRLRADGQNLKFEDVPMVYSPKGRMLEKAMHAFISVATELKDRDDAKQISQAVIQLPEREKKLRRDFDIIAVMNLITGTCQACKPLFK